MKLKRNHFAIMLAGVVLLSACGRGAEAPADEKSAFEGLADTIGNEIREGMATENISLSKGRNDLPAAEITPTGDLIINGEAITLDDKQRGLALDYRARLTDIAEAGAKVGLQGAELATAAMKEAAKAALNGNPVDVEAHMKKEAGAIRASAAALCDQLPALYRAQKDLAAAVPEFVPYATMDEGDINDCHTEVSES